MTIDVVEVKRRLLALLNDQNLVNEYIRQFGPTIDIKSIKAVKESKSHAIHSDEKPSVGNDPTYELQIQCPVCNQDKITRYELRAKSQQITQNKFLVPLYEGATPYKTVDYTFFATTVCPRCLFASSDKKDFIHAGVTGQKETKSQLTTNALMTLQEKIGERKSLIPVGCDPTTYFNRNRTYAAAIDSYRLSIARANIEAWYEQPNSYYKLSAYSLRIAHIMHQANLDNREVLREALLQCEEAFKTSNCPAEEIEMQVVYLIVALNLKLGDQKKANSYIGVFGNIHNTRVAEMRSNPKLTTVAIDKWADKAKYLWEDRDDPNLFKNE